MRVLLLAPLDDGADLFVDRGLLLFLVLLGPFSVNLFIRFSLVPGAALLVVLGRRVLSAPKFTFFIFVWLCGFDCLPFSLIPIFNRLLRLSRSLTVIFCALRLHFLMIKLNYNRKNQI